MGSGGGSRGARVSGVEEGGGGAGASGGAGGGGICRLGGRPERRDMPSVVCLLVLLH